MKGRKEGFQAKPKIQKGGAKMRKVRKVTLRTEMKWIRVYRRAWERKEDWREPVMEYEGISRSSFERAARLAGKWVEEGKGKVVVGLGGWQFDEEGGERGFAVFGIDENGVLEIEREGGIRKTYELEASSETVKRLMGEVLRKGIEEGKGKVIPRSWGWEVVFEEEKGRKGDIWEWFEWLKGFKEEEQEVRQKGSEEWLKWIERKAQEWKELRKDLGWN